MPANLYISNMKTKQYVIFRSWRILLILLFANAKYFGVLAQERSYPVSVSLLSQSWAFPFSEHARVSPFYPGITAGIFRLRTDKLFSFPQSAQLGYYLNYHAGSALFLHVDQGIRFASKCGLFVELSLGIGYFHGFHANAIYRQNSTGEFEKATDWGKPGMLFTTSQTLGFDLSEKLNIPLAPFIKTQWMASSPYFDMVVPIRPSSMTHIGTLIYF